MAFTSFARILGDDWAFHSPPFRAEISLRTLIPLFRSGSAHSGSPNWDDSYGIKSKWYQLKHFLQRQCLLLPKSGGETENSIKRLTFVALQANMNRNCFVKQLLWRLQIHRLALTPEGRPVVSGVSPAVWNLRAVIWFHFAISSLVLLASPVTLSILSFSACWSSLLNLFQKILQYFSLRDRLFLYDSCLADRRSKLVGNMCSVLPYGTGICCKHLYNIFLIFIASVHSFFKNTF